MRALNARIALAAGAATLMPSCERAPEPPPLRLAVGVHEVSLRVPDGWTHFDHGVEHRFHRGIVQISLADAGPVTPAAYRREVEIARTLFRRGQREDARAQLERLQVRRAFANESDWRRFGESWKVVRSGGLSERYTDHDVAVAYGAVVEEIEALESPSLAVIVERMLPDLDHGVQREVAKEQKVIVGGREGVRLESWDRLSHAHGRSYLFVLNEGNLLVARTELGEPAKLKPAFESLVASLEIDPPPPSGS